MNGEVFDILNLLYTEWKVLHSQTKAVSWEYNWFYDYLLELKYKLQIERMICNGTSNHEQFSLMLWNTFAYS